MSQKQLTAAIEQRCRSMNRRERIAKIRKLAGASPEDERFIRKTFPELYREAFQVKHRGAGVRSGSVRKRWRAGGVGSREVPEAPHSTTSFRLLSLTYSPPKTSQRIAASRKPGALGTLISRRLLGRIIC